MGGTLADGLILRRFLPIPTSRNDFGISPSLVRAAACHSAEIAPGRVDAAETGEKAFWGILGRFPESGAPWPCPGLDAIPCVRIAMAYADHGLFRHLEMLPIVATK